MPGPAWRGEAWQGTLKIPHRRCAPGEVATRAVLISGVKGGVGKTTVAVDLARRLAAAAPPVAFLDCDIDNPSAARALGLGPDARVTFGPDAEYVPWAHDGVEVFSQALVARKIHAIVWPGEQHRNLIADAVRHTRWSPAARIMVVDLPAGSGDELIGAVQSIGAKDCAMLLVTIPRHLDAAQRSVQIAADLGIRVLGAVENLSDFECPECGGVSAPFGRGHTEEFCSNYGVPFLGRVPIVAGVSNAMERGEPLDDRIAAPIIRAAEAVVAWA